MREQLRAPSRPAGSSGPALFAFQVPSPNPFSWLKLGHTYPHFSPQPRRVREKVCLFKSDTGTPFHGEPSVMWMLGCKQQKLVLLTSCQVRIFQKTVGNPRMNTEGLRCASPRRKEISNGPFPEMDIAREGVLFDWWTSGASCRTEPSR